ncbi:hypothetical protein SESBI_47462 [Sesbania bispinosa]|nr:hypothetical protein SESBI_47462 [Sesbania bispinosa]
MSHPRVPRCIKEAFIPPGNSQLQPNNRGSRLRVLPSSQTLLSRGETLGAEVKKWRNVRAVQEGIVDDKSQGSASGLPSRILE